MTTPNEANSLDDHSDSISPAVAEQQRLLHSEPQPPMGSDVVKPEGRKGDGSAILVVLVSYFVFVLTTWIIVLSNNPASLGWFKYHPLLQTLSIGSFTFGILTLQPTSQPATKAAGLKRHQIAMIGVGVPLLLLGTLAMYVTKSSHNAPHFTSWHGTLGIITVVLVVLQALGGGSTVWFNGALWGGGMRPKLVWKYHRVSGYIILPLLLLTAHLGGGWSDWVIGHSAQVARLLAYTVAPLLILAGIYTRVRPSKMKFF